MPLPVRYFISLCVLFCISCYPLRHNQLQIIRIKGSDTMLLLARTWAEEFTREYPNVSFYVEGGGTATGALALVNGKADICTASRPLRPEEIRQLAQNFDKIGMVFMVAKDALSIYIHPDNPVKNLSLTQLADIFTGKINNWSQVGGNNAPVIVTSRYPTSGTFFYFQEHVLNGQPYSEKAVLFATTEQMADFVARQVNAIGYGGFGWGKKVALCHIDGIEPTDAKVINGAYPISRYLYLYTVNIPQGYVKIFINWIMDRKNQHFIKQAGYFPIWNGAIKK